MAPQTTFLSLPREIRDAIYEYYVATPGGYACNVDTLVDSIPSQHGNHGQMGALNIAGILQTADRRPIDLSLSYTCKLVAREMAGVALRTNTITFTTVTSEELRILAARFGQLMTGCFDSERTDLLRCSGHTIAESQNEELKLKYPQFAPLLDRMKQEGALSYLGQTGDRLGPYGEAPSFYRAFQKDALAAIASSQVGREALTQYWLERCRKKAHLIPSLLVAQCKIDHWDIPSVDDMEYLKSCQLENSTFVSRVTRLRDRTRYRFSAAAAAIHVIRSLPITVRMHLRRVILEEDRESVAEPQCHAMGLIPFCKENPLLRVERRVSLWRNAFQVDGVYYRRGLHYRYDPTHRWTPWSLDSNQISDIIRGWVVEAMALEPAGMPAGSFSLLLDGQPVPQLCAQIFQLIVQRDAAWQAAWIESLERRLLPPLSWYDRRGELRLEGEMPGWVCENFSQILGDIAKGTSIVKCNFDVGEPWDIENIIGENRGWTQTQWLGGLRKPQPARWEPVAPLPDWKSIIEENLTPNGIGDDASSSSSEEGSSEED
ncbi:hypothetical protein CcaCcLH18_13195 [Colletotrichum camelliae]|nr:hypothetical protein CcaCcLH18_13195 [Colletotrichum camelliae]